MDDRDTIFPFGPAVLVDLYREATDLEVRANRWFGRHSQKSVLLHGQNERNAASREWTKLLARLLLMMAWLRVQGFGSITAGQLGALTQILAAAESEEADASLLPSTGQSLVRESMALYARISRLDAERPDLDAARELQHRLANRL